MKLAKKKPVIASGEIDNGQVKVPSVLLDVIQVTRENMQETVVKDGFHQAAEIAPPAAPATPAATASPALKPPLRQAVESPSPANDAAPAQPGAEPIPSPEAVSPATP